MTPDCHNRPALTGYWAPAGYIRGKRVLRWIPHRMSQPCKSWRVPDGTLPVPALHKWDCRDCRWFPLADVERVALTLRAMIEAEGEV